jgi:hypothetical protein
MRLFFLELLNNLHLLTGLRQLDKMLSGSPTASEGKEEINQLIDVMVRVAQQFPYIPEQDQKNIISNAVITDQEFTGLNARVIYKWLALHKDKYFKESQHVQEMPTEDWQPLTGDARLARLKEWEQALAPMMERANTTDRVALKEKMILGHERTEKVIHHSTPAEEVEKRLLHNKWIGENHDPKTGKPLDTWKSEEDWLKEQR